MAMFNPGQAALQSLKKASQSRIQRQQFQKQFQLQKARYSFDVKRLENEAKAASRDKSVSNIFGMALNLKDKSGNPASLKDTFEMLSQFKMNDSGFPAQKGERAYGLPLEELYKFQKSREHSSNQQVSTLMQIINNTKDPFEKKQLMSQMSGVLQRGYRYPIKDIMVEGTTVSYTVPSSFLISNITLASQFGDTVLNKEVQASNKPSKIELKNYKSKEQAQFVDFVNSIFNPTDTSTRVGEQQRPEPSRDPASRISLGAGEGSPPATSTLPFERGTRLGDAPTFDGSLGDSPFFHMDPAKKETLQKKIQEADRKPPMSKIQSTLKKWHKDGILSTPGLNRLSEYAEIMGKSLKALDLKGDQKFRISIRHGIRPDTGRQGVIDVIINRDFSHLSKEAAMYNEDSEQFLAFRKAKAMSSQSQQDRVKQFNQMSKQRGLYEQVAQNLHLEMKNWWGNRTQGERELFLKHRQAVQKGETIQNQEQIKSILSSLQVNLKEVSDKIVAQLGTEELNPEEREALHNFVMTKGEDTISYYKRTLMGLWLQEKHMSSMFGSGMDPELGKHFDPLITRPQESGLFMLFGTAAGEKFMSTFHPEKWRNLVKLGVIMPLEKVVSSPSERAPSPSAYFGPPLDSGFAYKSESEWD